MTRLHIMIKLGMVILFGAITLGQGAHAIETASPGMSRQLLMKQALPPMGPDMEARVIRVQFPSGFKTMAHTHEGPGPRYVLKGRLRVEDNGQMHEYGPGDVFWETGSAMTVHSIGGSDAEMIIFELAPKK